MELKLYVIGKTSMSFVEEGLREYSRRIGKYVKFSIQVLPQPKGASKMPAREQKSKEGELILQAMKREKNNILLDENGKVFNSREFAFYLQQRMNHSRGSIAFYVGGALGFSNDVINKADALISLSEMTFSHQLIRLIFMEQLYRAFTILRNEPYHND